MVQRHCRMALIAHFAVALLLLSSIPSLQASPIRERASPIRERASPIRETEHSIQSSSLRLKTMEQVVEPWSSKDNLRQKRLVGRDASNERCSQERLESMLRSCEMAASPAASSPAATSTDGSLSTEAPLFFCGANCSHLALLYAIECSNNEFLVNVSGACKLPGQNLSVECIYAVVIVKQGITACTRMVIDEESESSHEEEASNLFDRTKQYVDEQCCSLETRYQSQVEHMVYVDRQRRIVTNPPLIPPWLATNASEYQPVVDITSGELCMAKNTAQTTSHTSRQPTTAPQNMIDHQPGLLGMTASGAKDSHSVQFVWTLLCVVIVCLYFTPSLRL